MRITCSFVYKCTAMIGALIGLKSDRLQTMIREANEWFDSKSPADQGGVTFDKLKKIVIPTSVIRSVSGKKFRLIIEDGHSPD